MQRGASGWARGSKRGRRQRARQSSKEGSKQVCRRSKAGEVKQAKQGRGRGVKTDAHTLVVVVNRIYVVAAPRLIFPHPPVAEP